MRRYSQVQVYLDEAVNGIRFGGHGPIWRGKDRDEFVALQVFSFDFVTVGDGPNSNLVKVLRGTLPGVSQMPPDEPEYNPVPAAKIDFIEEWITDGCPAELSATVTIDPNTGGPLPDPTLHNDYWREFDNWAAFYTSPQTSSDIFSRAFPLAASWGQFAHGDITEAQLLQQVQNPDTTAAIHRLATRMMQTVEAHYGNPVPLLTLLDSHELFGRGVSNNGLPLDPLRPDDPRHQMNGRSMWFYWCGTIDACFRLGIEPDFWHGYARAVLLGLLNDGVIRNRFPVSGFSRSDPQVGEQMREHVRQIPDSQLGAALSQRFIDSGLSIF